MLNFQALRTPADDGAILIEPAAQELRALVEENQARLASYPGGIGGTDWATLRRQTRAAIGADKHTPVIMTGHQPEFIHPGVWAKHIVADRLARALEGAAVNLVVDNDVPKTLALAVPVATTDGIIVHQVAFVEKGAGLPYEFLPGLDARMCRQVRERIAALLADAYDASAMPAFFEGFCTAQDGGLAGQMAAGRTAVERIFDVRLHDVRVSRVWGGLMPADWIRRPREFAASYNQALAEYRREEGIRDADRPIPDLHIDGSRVELPLWVCAAGSPRQRLYVEQAAGRIHFFAGTEPAGTIATDDLDDGERFARFLHAVGGRVIRPRALALTLWARLLACDLFIHGIGGAKYDRITDRIIRSYYGVEPPAMACVSATLRLPLPRSPVSRADLFAARRRVRDVRYQPERWAADIPEALPLLAERLHAIEESERLRRDTDGRRDHSARREVFERLRGLNARLLALRPTVADEARAELERLEHMARQDRIATGREYFFALFPRMKLARLCDNLPAAKDF
ncbi:MAG: hypothetical protein ACPMAQ_02580 [Phycisphaerae bacterium]